MLFGAIFINGVQNWHFQTGQSWSPSPSGSFSEDAGHDFFSSDHHILLGEEVAEKMKLSENKAFNPIRKGIPHFAYLSNEERESLIKENPLYGHIICRCEVVSEGEIVEAIRRVPGAKDLDGVKRRTRAGMGRCQMGFCTPKVMEIIARELHEDITSVTKKGHESFMVDKR